MTESAPPAPVTTIQIVCALLALYLIWGSTYLAIGIAVESMPPLLMVGARFLTAGILLFVVMHRLLLGWRK